MNRLIKLLGSLRIAVPLLITIAGVLAWGTIYEARFGTASVQRFIYHSWWFQVLLAFLAINLATAALERYPWQWRHLPFVLAHIGIILILLGGILGSRFGVDGQMMIPEGQAERTLETPGNVLVVHLPAAPDGLHAQGTVQAGQANSGIHAVIPTQFETQAWVHQPNVTFPVALQGRMLQLTVDRYYPDAISDEAITPDGPTENPAVHLLLEHNEQQGAFWLLARDPERFRADWGDAHVLFLAPKSDEQLKQLLEPGSTPRAARGTVSIKVPGMARAREIAVPDELHQTINLQGTPYRLTFKDYFPDFALAEKGPVSRSGQPNNPAVSFLISGPEGDDAYLLFALHPEFQSMHGFSHKIAAEVNYSHTASVALPPNSIAVVRTAEGKLLGVLTGSGDERQVIRPLEEGTQYTHPSLGYQLQVVAYYPKALVTQQISNRSNEVHVETLHITAREGHQTAEVWLGLRGSAELALGVEPVIVEYRPDQRELPVTIKLLDFRKIDYPGTEMASAFESDVEMTDTKRGIILMRKISMNKPLRYRGYSFFQSSYIPGPTETTVLSVRNDPGTPCVYAGFIIVILGVVSMFLLGKTSTSRVTERPRRRRTRTRSRAT